jgi:hypothetical protein
MFKRESVNFKEIWLSRKKSERKNRKGFFPCKLTGQKEWEKKQKKIFLASWQGKKSERNVRKRFSLRVGREESERRNRKKKWDGAPLIGAIIRENSNLADRAPSKIVNLPAKN